MRVLLLAVLLVVAACDGGDDPTFMKVCEVDDTFYYPAGLETVSGACADPFEVMWPGLPIRVSEAAFDPDYHASLEQAIDFWNGELGLTAFVIDETDPQVSVVIGSASDPGVGAAFHVRGLSGELGAVIEYRKPGGIDEAYYVMAHELGHVIGLAHDPGFGSVMYPELDDGWDPTPDQEFRFIEVTSNDRDAIRARY